MTPVPAERVDEVISARGLTRRYGALVAVDGLDLVVAPGTIIGLIGPSGSGKTTTVRLLTGIETPTAGEAVVLGVAPTAFTPAHRERIGYLPQLNVLYPNLSLQENLEFVASLYGLPRRRRDRLDELLEFVGLRERRRTLLRAASGGMQRRLALAAALVHDPELLFLDEPTAGIDPVLRRRFWDHFRGLRDEGRTLVVTTQYVGEAAYCDQVAVLAEGRLLTVDTPDGLRRQALGGRALDLVAAAPIDPGVLIGLGALPFVIRAEPTGGEGRALRILVDDPGAAIPRVQDWLDGRGVQLQSVATFEPPFDDVFVELVERGRPGG